MPEVTACPLPFPAYRGDDPFVFVSYAHRDREAVFAEMARLRDLGCRIWYDEGIRPGGEWPAELESALERCAFFLAFVTDRAVDSHNVRDEINFAIDHKKPFVAVHLEETVLRHGLKLRTSRLQAILRHCLSEAEYHRKLEQALPRQLFGGAARELPATFENSIGMTFVLVKPGKFFMGSPVSEADHGDDEHQHEVTITKPFYLGVHPVTQREWKTVMDGNPSHFSYDGGKGSRVKDINDADLDLFPVEKVSWADAEAFLRRLTERDEEARDGLRYRLPSEAEWEYACRGGHRISEIGDGHTLPFHFGQPSPSLSSLQANFDGTPAAARPHHEFLPPITPLLPPMFPGREGKDARLLRRAARHGRTDPVLLRPGEDHAQGADQKGQPPSHRDGRGGRQAGFAGTRADLPRRHR